MKGLRLKVVSDLLGDTPFFLTELINPVKFNELGEGLILTILLPKSRRWKRVILKKVL